VPGRPWWHPTAISSRRHIRFEPSGIPSDEDLKNLPSGPWKSTDRFTFRCHPRCGANIPVRTETLHAAITKAATKGRRVVWLPTDLTDL